MPDRSCRRFRRAVLVLGLAAFAAATGEAIAAGCPQATAPVVVRLVQDPGRVTYDHRKTAAQIAGVGGGVFSPTEVPRGLTVVKPDARISVKITYTGLGTDEGCVWPTEAEIYFGYTAIDVYIDRQYDRQSCAYRAISRHEDTHVNIYRRSLASYAPVVQRHVVIALRDKPWFRVRTVDQARQVYPLYLGKVLASVLEDFKREIITVNAAIDIPTVYAETQRQCTDW